MAFGFVFDGLGEVYGLPDGRVPPVHPAFLATLRFFPRFPAAVLPEGNIAD
ncbi:hypothetical protein W911_10080 [Hyphomicrobium nitrativorans NL23]|uniref:Uncharacterized protein n=1 Tax=Hyphomicrobium nitrativorans NL23 TaxID=1029756 RepID=V5SI54_9HYPH|nr:hypothetical protein W911_10080 [Hyphomicrobium nitrativorans NL23]